MANVFDENVAVKADPPKPLKGYLQKRGPRAHHPWKRRWFVLSKNTISYYKDSTDTEPIASIGLEHCTSLLRTSSVAPKNMTDCAFALDIREHKKIRTYYLSAHSSGEKKQWLDAMLQSKKYYAANTGAAATRNARVSSSVSESDLSNAKQRIKALTVENQRLLDEIDDLRAGGGGAEEHEDLLVELEEAQEKLEEERYRRQAAEKKLAKGASAAVDEEEIREDVRLEFEDRIEELQAEIRKLKKSGGGGGGGGRRKKDPFDDDDDDPFDDLDDFDDFGSSSKRKNTKGGDAALKRENDKLKRELAKLKKSGGGADEERVLDLEDEVEELNAEVEALQNQVADLELDLQDAKASGRSRSNRGDSARMEELEEENARLRESLEELEAHLDEVEADVASKIKQIRELERNAGGGDQVAELEQQVEQLNATLDELEAENDELRARGAGGGGGGGGDQALIEENERLEDELEKAKESTQKYRAKLQLLRREYKSMIASK